jgi:adenylate cyclase
MASKAVCAGAGNRVRITAQLIEAETGAHVWAERYDRPLGDIFELQAEIDAQRRRRHRIQPPPGGNRARQAQAPGKPRL